MATILIVDDRPTNRDVLTTLLGYDGHRLLEASDGAAAIRIVRAERPDVVISDVVMPTMDGFEFVRQMRADPSIAATKVIFYTAIFHELTARSLAARCGVEHVLIKPSDPETILATVKRSLADRSSETNDAPLGNFDRDWSHLMTDTLAKNVVALESSNLQLNTLLEFSRELAVLSDPNVILEFACDVIRRTVGACHAAVFLHEKTADPLRPVLTLHASEHSARPDVASKLWPIRVRAQFDRSSTFRIQLLREEKSEIDFDVATFYLAAPIGWSKVDCGWICLADKLDGSAFTEADERMAEGLASTLALAHRNASNHAELQKHLVRLELEIARRKTGEDNLRRARDELEHEVASRTVELKCANERLAIEAILDPLTGLHNRRYASDLIERELSRANRSGTPIAFLMIDIDHFKRVNDHFGHDAGDSVLRKIGTFLKQQARREDSVCRYGGEEFLVVLPGMTGAHAWLRAERIRERILKVTTRYRGAQIGLITLSIGIAVFPDHGTSAEKLLQRADDALYRAKNEGRDQTVLTEAS